MRITAVVLNWKRPEDTIACVRSLAETAPDVEVIVVDNASGDGSVERIRDALPDVTLIENGANDGYAGGNNVGIARALEGTPEALLILNNDVVVQPGAVEAMAEHLQRPVGMVAPLSLLADRPDVIDFYRARVDLRNMALIAPGRDDTLPDRGLTEVVETDYVTGSAMLIHADLVRSIGPFDERYFLVWEDVDLSLRARAAGARLVVEPRARVLHGRSASFGQDGSPLYKYFFVRNSFLIVAEHLRWPWRTRTRAMIERRYEGWVDAGDDPLASRAIAMGLADGRAGRFGPPSDEVRAALAADAAPGDSPDART